MKKKLIIAALSLVTLMATAQNNNALFKGYVYNKEYDVYLDINFYDSNITVPGQEIFGKIPGYFGDKRDSRKWLITDASIKGNTAYISMINDYGSEDLKAELTVKNDGTYELKQVEGSTLKIARNRKWCKMPKKLIFNK